MELGLSPRTEVLRRLDSMSHSELKEVAKERGLKANLEHNKMLWALYVMEVDDISTYSTPTQRVINSCIKKKQQKFDEDSKTPLATPRRGTYSLESPTVLKTEEAATPSCNNPSPDGKPANAEEEGKEAVKSPSEDAPLVTGERTLRSRKVSFVSPVVTPRRQKTRNSSLKMRPKTPVPSSASRRTPVRTPRRDSLRSAKRMSSALDCETPMSEIKEENTSAKLPQNDDDEVKGEIAVKSESPKTVDVKKELDAQSDANPSDEINEVTSPLKTEEVKEMDAQKLPQSDANPSGSMSLTDRKGMNASAKKKQLATPGSRNLAAIKENTSLKKKQIATPNFKKIHEKAFEKMESIDDYQKRKMDSAKKAHINLRSRVTKAKSQIPAFSGIPFIPSSRPNLAKESRIAKPVIANKKGTDTPNKMDLKSGVRAKKGKFDLKASLSRKLGYTPYTGPLKPLVETTQLNSSCVHNNKPQPVNPVVNNKRTQNRAALKGVRTNKRFELQMKNRKL